jgi:hypothetical protein
MTKAELEEIFPGLKQGFEITSPADEEYNCIAWSVNDTRQWWWPAPPGRWPGKYWPPGIPHEETLAAFVAVYEALGFRTCQEREFEVGYDKVAIYADRDGTVTHASRWWLEDNGWSCKLGEENDIRHHTLESIEGTDYGRVVRVMKRARNAARE